jgi:hypothetical protein
MPELPFCPIFFVRIWTVFMTFKTQERKTMKNFVWILAAVFLFSFTAVSFAQEQQGMMNEGGPGGTGMDGGGQGGGQRGEGMKNPMMMGMMNKPSMIATSDGGVIVLAGPKLAKYDKDLNLIKEVELKRDKGPEQGQQPGPAQNNEPPPQP